MVSWLEKSGNGGCPLSRNADRARDKTTLFAMGSRNTEAPTKWLARRSRQQSYQIEWIAESNQLHSGCQRVDSCLFGVLGVGARKRD